MAKCPWHFSASSLRHESMLYPLGCAFTSGLLQSPAKWILSQDLRGLIILLFWFFCFWDPWHLHLQKTLGKSVGAERHVTQLLFLSLPTALKTSDIRVRRSCIIQPPEIHAAKSRCMGTQRESSQVAQISKSAQPTHRIMSQIKD